MSYSAITATEIEVGKPVKKSLFNKVKDNFDDHETRVNSLEAGASKIEVANFELGGYIDHYNLSELSSVAMHHANTAFTISELEVVIIDSPNALDSGGSAIVSSADGTLELELEKSTDGGANFGTILSTRPQVIDGENGAGSSSNDVANVSAILANSSVNSGDILRIKVTSKKDTQGSFLILCYGSL